MLLHFHCPIGGAAAPRIVHEPLQASLQPSRFLSLRGRVWPGNTSRSGFSAGIVRIGQAHSSEVVPTAHPIHLLNGRGVDIAAFHISSRNGHPPLNPEPSHRADALSRALHLSATLAAETQRIVPPGSIAATAGSSAGNLVVSCGYARQCRPAGSVPAKAIPNGRSAVQITPDVSPTSAEPPALTGEARAECGSQSEATREAQDPGQALVVASFYKFADLPDYAELRQPIRELCERNLVSGGIILAPEGINGSICGTRRAVEAVFASLRSDSRLAGLTYREQPAGPEEEAIHGQRGGQSQKSPLAPGPDAPFRWDHVRVKLKKEVVSMGVDGVDPHKLVGKYVSPQEWNELLMDPDTMVVDVRNSYETRIGMFRRAVDPATESFRQFPAWVEDRLVPAGTASGTEGGGGEGKEGGSPIGADGSLRPGEGPGPGGRGRSREQSGGMDQSEATNGFSGPGSPHNDLREHPAGVAAAALSANGIAGFRAGGEGSRKEEESEGKGREGGGAEGVFQGSATREGLQGAAGEGKKVAPRRVAMYCTGGIRCEKASSFLLAKGFQEVYHLQGGILRYLEEVPPSESLWEGECFVFDQRVAVGAGLKLGTYRLCYACKQPIRDEDTESPLWEEGVSCPYCYETKTEEEKARARARQAQFAMWGVVGGPDKGRRPKSPDRSQL